MALYVKTGQYTGTGSGSVTTTLTFTPKAVFIWGPAQQTATTFRPRLKTNTMSANDSAPIADLLATFSDGNLTFSGNSFVSSGTSTDGFNISSKEYYWLALGGTDCVTGSYTGNATDNRNITGLGINPDLVIVRAIGATSASRFKAGAMGKTTDASTGLGTGVAIVTNAIQQLITGGFEIGTAVNVNTSSIVYHYIAIEKTNNLEFFNEGTYVGNATDDRNITGVGFTPTFVFIKGNNITNSAIRSVETTDTSSQWTSANTATDRIQTFVSDGFQIGTNTSVNANTVAYYWFAFKDNEPNTGNFLAFM